MILTERVIDATNQANEHGVYTNSTLQERMLKRFRCYLNRLSQNSLSNHSEDREK